ncbi:hypothetical protein BC830DRAFT_1095610 [Chytriomyces sp. MP71]|nr:hypothetical protein BC830DRAFT_1095610 [Chytriomyces sp. MP71]
MPAILFPVLFLLLQLELFTRLCQCILHVVMLTPQPLKLVMPRLLFFRHPLYSSPRNAALLVLIPVPKMARTRRPPGAPHTLRITREHKAACASAASEPLDALERVAELERGHGAAVSDNLVALRVVVDVGRLGLRDLHGAVLLSFRDHEVVLCVRLARAAGVGGRVSAPKGCVKCMLVVLRERVRISPRTSVASLLLRMR